MKKLLILLVVLMIFPVSGAQNVQSEQIRELSKDHEKEFLINYFKRTASQLEAAVSGLNEEQLQFKPSPEQWSVAQILDHIILTEKKLFTMLQEQMEAPANPERRADIKMTDEQVMAGVIDRSKKFKTSKDLEGKEGYSDPEEAIEALLEQRQEIFELINETPVEEFRNRVSRSPMGSFDAYQSLLFLAGHTARHTLQIEEVKSSNGFPSD